SGPRGPGSIYKGRASHRSQRSASEYSPAQIREPARFSSAGAMTGSAPQPRRREGLDLRCEGELSQAGDLEVGASDPPRKGGALAQVPLAVLVPQRPRFNGSEVHERDRAQVAIERDVLVGLAGY